MKIDKSLNLVIPIYGDEVPKLDAQGKPVVIDGKPVMIEQVAAYVHSTPVSRETFERYFLVISQTFSAVYNQGLGMAAGPRVAMLLLKSVAEQNKSWEGPDGVAAGLIEEIRRLTVVLVRDGAGWQPAPLKVAVDRGVLSPDDSAEVENAIVFFIVASAMHRRTERRAILEGAADLWGSANLVVELYGVRQFLADVDRDRQFWRDCPCHCPRALGTCECGRGRETCVSACLSWAAEEGFAEFIRQTDGMEFDSAHDFRARYARFVLLGRAGQ